MTDSFAIAINSRVRDVIEQSQMNAVGDFSKLFSVRFTELIESDVPVRDAIERALRETGSTFRNLNPGRIRHFEAQLADLVRPIIHARSTLRETLHDFRRYAERQLVSGFKKNKNEEYCRSVLQTYLERDGRTTREVQSGGGLIDVLVSSGEPVEAKLWRGPEYFQDGIEELREYMRTEGQGVGYYIVFDTRTQNPSLPQEAELAVPEGRIIQIAVRMNPGQPSTKRSRARLHKP